MIGAVQLFVIAGAALGFLAVATGAFGAHALKKRLAESGQQAAFDTAVRYQLAHSVVLLVLPGVFSEAASARWVGWLMFAGTTVFCGALYLRSVADQPRWGIIAPVGGLALLAGWGLAVVLAVTAR